MRALGASRVLVSLTHERRHAAALVVLLGETG
jgi:phosphopantetheinyl transferase (holo-ACP synthase)